MREPITTLESVVIYCRPHKDGWRASAGRLKAHSTGGASSAAVNLAKRFFWGGNTKAFIGPEEAKALHLAQRGETGNCFVAWITKPVIAEELR